ncbi:MAG: histidine--tRNA ligase [Clostridia bacterium]|nr:histidine--tRNA ligase [Clostridia bacterium]
MEYKKPKGTRDILPTDIAKWQRMENSAKQFAKLYNCKEIRTPVFEDAKLFLRSVGEGTDIVSKEMYIFKDKAERELALRPEGTAGVVRAFVENGLFNMPLPLKLYYIGSNFRYENPQAGRYREFAQFGVECFGNSNPLAEVEVMQLATRYLESLDIKGIKLAINSIGCEECRAKYIQALKDFVEQNLNKFCNDCKYRYKTNPLRILDCKNEICQDVLKNAPKLKDYLCDDCKEHFEKVKELLTENNVKYEVTENLVRGFDYYTKTVFEFICEDFDGKSIAVGGGGRYDNLVEELGGGKVPCVGFAMGLDRMVMLMQEEQLDVDVYLINAGNVACDKLYNIASKLRDNNISVECNLSDRSVKAQFKFADKLNAKYVCVLGDDELLNNEITVKNMQTKEEKKVELSNLINFLKND